MTSFCPFHFSDLLHRITLVHKCAFLCTSVTDIDIDREKDNDIEIDTVIDTEKEHLCEVQTRTRNFKSARALSFYHITAIIYNCNNCHNCD